jgi:hypothetical protein
VSLRLSPAILASVYEALRVCPPFRRWKLPPADAIKFRVMNYSTHEGHYTRVVRTDRHEIGVSGVRIGHFDSLAIVMGHEMIHLYQAVAKLETRGEHNADFRRRAALVCKTLGFDPRLFC